MNYKIAEYTKAVLKDKPHFHISFVMNVSPECDCWNHNDAAIIPDLGILASMDPVALDQACADLVNKLYVPGTDKDKADQLMSEVLNMQNDFLSRISHTEPGSVRKFYKQFYNQFNEAVISINDDLLKLA